MFLVGPKRQIEVGAHRDHADDVVAARSDEGRQNTSPGVPNELDAMCAGARKRLVDGGGGITWSETVVTGVHKYDLLPDEKRGTLPVSSAALPKRSALKRSASGGRGSGGGQVQKGQTG